MDLKREGNPETSPTPNDLREPFPPRPAQSRGILQSPEKIPVLFRDTPIRTASDAPGNRSGARDLSDYAPIPRARNVS
jgi:hypothetical protein